MPIGASDNTAMAFVSEATPGVNPGGNLSRAAHSGFSIVGTPTVNEPNNVRADGQAVGQNRSGQEVAVTINQDFLFGTLDDLLAGVFRRNDWTTAVNIDRTDIQAIAATNRLSAVAAGVFDDLAPGYPVRIVGQTQVGWGVVSAVAAGAPATLDLVPGTMDLTDEAAGGQWRIQSGGTLFPGQDRRSFFMERQNADIPEFQSSEGTTLSQVTITVTNPGQITLALQGDALRTAHATATFGTGTHNDLPVPPVFRTDDQGVLAMTANGGALDFSQHLPTALTLVYGPPTRSLGSFGVFGTSRINTGSWRVTGTLDMWMSETAVPFLQSAAVDTRQPLFFVLSNGIDAYAWYTPRAVFTSSGDPAAAGRDADHSNSFNFTGDFQTGDPQFLLFMGRFPNYLTP